MKVRLWVILRSNRGHFWGILPSSVIAVVDDAAAPAFLKTHPTPIAAI